MKIPRNGNYLVDMEDDRQDAESKEEKTWQRQAQETEEESLEKVYTRIIVKS